MKPILSRNRVIVPLSGKITGDQCFDSIESLAPHVWGFKFHPTTIIRLLVSDHTDVLQLCYDNKTKIFIDLKGFDIPSEIANMIRDLEQAAEIDIITVHQSGGDNMVRAAVEASTNAMIFPVTILTSMGAEDTVHSYCEYGSVETSLSRADSIRDGKIVQFAADAFECGAAGTISSPVDLKLFQENAGATGQPCMLRCTPGIRPAGNVVSNDDQNRVTTPTDAAIAGSDLIVVGRPILQAPDPVEAAIAIQTEFWDARSAL